MYSPPLCMQTLPQFIRAEQTAGVKLFRAAHTYMGRSKNHPNLFFLHHYTGICAYRTDRLQAGHLLLRLQLLTKTTLHFSHIANAPVSSRTMQGILLGCNRRDITLLFLSSLSIILLLSNSGLLGTFSEYYCYTKSKNY